MKQAHTIKYLLIASVVTIVVLLPDKYLFSSGQSLCIHKSLLGIQCPMCGLTRASHELIYLRLAAAVQYNFTILFLPLILFTEMGIDFTSIKAFFTIRKILIVALLVSLAALYTVRIIHYFN